LPSLKPASKYLRAEQALCRNYTFHVPARKRLAGDSTRVNARGRRVEINLSADSLSGSIALSELDAAMLCGFNAQFAVQNF